MEIKNFIEFLPSTKFSTSFDTPEEEIDTSENYSDSYHDFTDCGAVLPENVVVIDIDDLGDDTRAFVDKLSETTFTVMTDKGCHLYYKYDDLSDVKNPVGICPLGFEVEYKRKRGKVNWVTFKRNGKEREFFNEDIIAPLPEYFKQGNYHSLWELSDGENRYNKIYENLRSVTANRLNVMTVINDIILGEELEQKQFRKLALASSKRIPGKLELEKQPNLDVDYILDACTPHKLGNETFYNIDDKYTASDDVINRFIYKCFPFHSSYRISEIKTQISMKCEFTLGFRLFPINLPNGRLENGKFYQLRSTEFTPFELPYKYDPMCEVVEEVDYFFDFVTGFDADLKEYLFQVFAASLFPDTGFRSKNPRFHILYGDGGNGKGETLKIFRKIFGAENCSANKMEQLDDKDNVIAMKFKLMNLGDDIEEKPIDNKVLSNVKNISSSDIVSKREIYKKSGDLLFFTNLIFSSNHILKSFEKGNSFRRRIFYVPFNCSIFEDTMKDDTRFTDDFFRALRSEKAYVYIMKQLVEVYLKMGQSYGFYKESSTVEDFMEDFHMENSNIELWISDIQYEVQQASTPEEEELVLNKHLLGRTKADVYADYKIWCETSDGTNALSSRQMNDAIERVFHIINKPTRVDGKVKRIYVRK